MSEERKVISSEFKEIFEYIFGRETDIRKAIPIAGVRRLGWGWAFLIAYYYSRLYPKFCEIDEDRKRVEPSLSKLLASEEADDEETKEDAELFFRWTILLEKFFPLVVSTSEGAHAKADRLISKVAMPEMKYTITETNEMRTPFWHQYVGVERAGEPRRPKPPKIYEEGEE